MTTAKLATFEGQLTKPREAIALSKGATDQIPDNFAAVERILTRQLDLFMHRFKTSNSDLDRAYQVDRLFVDTGGGHDSSTPPNQEPVPKERKVRRCWQ